MSKKMIVDCSTNEVTMVDLTSDEVAAAEALAAQVDKDLKAAEAAATQAATDKASGNSKLKELGLTDAEIAALVG